MNNNSEYIFKAMVKLIRSSIYDIEKCINYINTNKENAAIAYLNSANSQMLAAEAIYYGNFDFLCRNELEDLFNQFNVFNSEVLENFSTNHSHQWSNIEYEKLKDIFENSICKF